MTALTQGFQRSEKPHTEHIIAMGAKADEVFYFGGVVCHNLFGIAETGKNDPTLAMLGIAREDFDNTGGANGVVTDDGDSARIVKVDAVGLWEFAVTGTAPVAFQKAYLVDDNLVSADPQTGGVIVGEFVRQGLGGKWWVDISKKFDPYYQSVYFPDVNTAGSVWIPRPGFPLSDVLVSIRAAFHAANSVAAAVITPRIAGNPVAGMSGALDFPAAGVAGDQAGASASGGDNLMIAGALEILSDGAGTGVVPATFTALFR